MTMAVVIATRGRPQMLLDTVLDLLRQTRLPDELCIVDSGEEAMSKQEITGVCQTAGLPLRYAHPAPPGLTRQRNQGVDLTTGEVVVFMDDDVRLSPGCLEEVEAEFLDPRNAVGGVRVNPMFPESPSRASRLYCSVFGLACWSPGAKAQMTRAFYPRGPSHTDHTVDVACIQGYFMAYSRAVFQTNKFDERLAGYGWREDIDFSFRVARHFRLVQTTFARCHHLKAPAARLAHQELEMMKVVNHVYLHQKNLPQTVWNRVALWWSLMGQLFRAAALSLRSPALWPACAGVARGMAAAARGRKPDGAPGQAMPHP